VGVNGDAGSSGIMSDDRIRPQPNPEAAEENTDTGMFRLRVKGCGFLNYIQHCGEL